MLSALGPAALAQGSLKQPFEGTVHDYTVDGITSGADYLFYLTSDINGSIVLDDALEVEFDFLGNASGTIGTDGLATMPIQWNTGAAEHIYYLWLEASIGECSNHIRLEITPQSNLFDLVAENVPLENSVSCPETNPGNGFNPVTGEYFAGSTALEFKVRRENGTPNTAVPGTTYDWSFIPERTVDPDLAGHINVIVSVEEATQDGDRYIVSGAYDEVTVTVLIQNAPGYDLDVSLLLSNQLESNTNLTDNNPDNDRVTHTIQVMPVINGMGGV
jgi:hypothetical protein